MYLLDWQETAHGQRPTASAVKRWLDAQGFGCVGTPKVYANGMVTVETEADPTGAWPAFAPLAETLEDKLGAHVAELLAARAEVLAISESSRSPQDRLLLALTGLVLFGYGVKAD